jgi:hypothetical protein
VISGQPQGGVYTRDETSVVPLTVTAKPVSDGGVLSYQWYSNIVNDNTTGSAISGQTNDSFTPPTDTEGSVYYYVVVTNTLGGKSASTASDTAEIIVNTLVNAQVPNITSQPIGGVSYPRNTLSPTALSVTVDPVTDGGALSYQWYSDDDSDRGNGGETTVGTNSPSCTPLTDTEGTLYYYVKVTNTITTNPGDGGVKVQSLYSATAAITITVTHAGQPSITTQPQGASYHTGVTATALSVTASVDGLTGTLSYQWYSNTSDNNTTGISLGTGARDASYTPPTTAEGTVYYYVVVTNAITINPGDGGDKTASVTSDTAALIVSNQINAAVPVISVQPVGGTYILNRPAAALSVTASVGDGGSLSYQWYSNTSNNNTTGTSLGAGARDASYTPPTTIAGTVYYYVIVTNTISDNGDGGNKTAFLASNPAEVTAMAAFTDIAGITSYLSGVSGGATDTDPVPLPVGMELSAANWTNLLIAIKNGDKYVALDLSACTRGSHSSGGGLYSDGTFDAAQAMGSSGKDKIVSLTLPDAATGIEGGPNWSFPTFRYFTSLKSVSGKNVTGIGNVAFATLTTLVTMSFPEALSIGNGAFIECGMTEVNFPKATHIGDGAFSVGNSSSFVISVYLPEALTIYPEAFGGCDKLETVYLPKATHIYGSAFGACDALTTATLLAATYIGEEAFRGCTDLETVNIPNAVTIAAYAFQDCSALTAISLPNTLTSIGNMAFLGSGLVSVNLPASLSSLEGNPFAGCTSLNSFTVSGANPNFSADGAKLMNKTGTVLRSWPKAIGNISLPATVTGLGDFAFVWNNVLTAVDFPGVTNIGTMAFALSGLVSANLPLAQSIGENAFYYCTALVTLELPAVPPSLGPGVFKNTDSYSYPDLYINVPTGAVGNYTSSTLPGWGVLADTAAGTNSGKYGDYHKRILITAP